MKNCCYQVADHVLTTFKKRYLFLLFLLSFFSVSLWAQQTLKGRVTAVDGILSNATIQVKGTSTFTQTDALGNFSISANPGDVLVVTSVGFNSQEITVGAQTTIDVKLSANSAMMTDVVVVGYGTQKRSDVTGSVSSVPKTRLTQLPVTNILHAIEGSVAGVNISQTSSVPGSSAAVLVRGQNSITAGTGPFIVVDGIRQPSANGCSG